jgi:hypothetical protein
MNRRLLILPLLALIAVLLLLAVAIAAGGVPNSLVTPLISGMVAALLTGGLGLWGMWMNLTHQIERDRLDRIRDAYAKLLRSAHLHVQAAGEAMLYPNGRPFPEPYGFSAGGAYMPTMDPLVKERAQYNPYSVEESLLEQGKDLAIEAESAIYLEEGSKSGVLSAFGRVEVSYDELRKSLAENNEAVTTELHKAFDKSVEDLREAARIRLNKIAGR